jgi:hypothetical protein
MTSDRYFTARDEITTILYAHGCENISFTPVNDVREVVLTFSHSESNFRFGAKPHDQPILRDRLMEKIDAIKRGTLSFDEVFGPYQVARLLH